MTKETKTPASDAEPATANVKRPMAATEPPPIETQPPKTKPIAKVVLKTLCAETKLDPRLAREKLRIAIRDPEKFPELSKAHKARQAWEWPEDSAAVNEARVVLTT